MSTNNADVIGMLAVAAVLALWLFWPMATELCALIASKVERRRIRREQVAWNEQRTARMRDVLR